MKRKHFFYRLTLALADAGCGNKLSIDCATAPVAIQAQSLPPRTISERFLLGTGGMPHPVGGVATTSNITTIIGRGSVGS